jgi:hypothetical protein
MARPVVCGKRGASLVAVAGHDERRDPVDPVIVGFLECPQCQAAYVYMRPERRDDGSTG